MNSQILELQIEACAGRLAQASRSLAQAADAFPGATTHQARLARIRALTASINEYAHDLAGLTTGLALAEAAEDDALYADIASSLKEVL